MPDTDVLTELKRESEVSNRPSQTAEIPKPPALRNEFSDASYKMVKKPEARPKEKGETEKSLDWNAQQRKVAEAQ
jgi:hypothetical protein